MLYLTLCRNERKVFVSGHKYSNKTNYEMFEN